jgi:hypothetical protein
MSTAVPVCLSSSAVQYIYLSVLSLLLCLGYLSALFFLSLSMYIVLYSTFNMSVYPPCTFSWKVNFIYLLLLLSCLLLVAVPPHLYHCICLLLLCGVFYICLLLLFYVLLVCLLIHLPCICLLHLCGVFYICLLLLFYVISVCLLYSSSLVYLLSVCSSSEVYLISVCSSSSKFFVPPLLSSSCLCACCFFICLLVLRGVFNICLYFLSVCSFSGGV